MDEIQRVLIQAGRKDLAQIYYKKSKIQITSSSDPNDVKKAKGYDQLVKDLKSKGFRISYKKDSIGEKRLFIMGSTSWVAALRDMGWEVTLHPQVNDWILTKGDFSFGVSAVREGKILWVK